MQLSTLNLTEEILNRISLVFRFCVFCWFRQQTRKFANIAQVKFEFSSKENCDFCVIEYLQSIGRERSAKETWASVYMFIFDFLYKNRQREENANDWQESRWRKATKPIHKLARTIPTLLSVYLFFLIWEFVRVLFHYFTTEYKIVHMYISIRVYCLQLSAAFETALKYASINPSS